MAPVHDPVYSVVEIAGAGNVDAVIIDGVVRKKDGKLTFPADVLRQAPRRARRVRRAHHARRRLQGGDRSAVGPAQQSEAHTMTKQITRRTALAGLSATAAFPAPALAQSGRPITLMHGFTPGANIDITARIVAEGLSKRLGQPIVVESRLGAGGTVSAAAVARAAPDGSTLTILPSGHPIAPALYKQLAYNAVNDFSFISMLTENPFILVTYPDHRRKTIADVVKAAQANPGKLTYATAGNGTGMHLASELLVSMGALKIQHVPYRGSPQAITDLIAKRVDLQMDTPSSCCRS